MLKPRQNWIAFSLLLLTLAIAAIASSTSAAEPAPPKTVRLLAVGNSFTGNATGDLESLVAASGNKLVMQRLIIGGSSLAQHWKLVEEHERDPKAGLYNQKDAKVSLKQALMAEPWDFVTIQQVSGFSHDVKGYRPYAGQFRDFIKLHAPKAELLLHQTWAYRVDAARFTPDAKFSPKTKQEMHEQLTKAYDEIAAELSVRVIPVGDAFQLAETDPKWGYKPDATFDKATAKPPKLPDQTHSLHTGYSWGKNADGSSRLHLDANHASPAGKYLAGCVWFEFLFDQSCVGIKFVPKGMDADYARFLQETAHKAVAARKAVKREAATKSGG